MKTTTVLHYTDQPKPWNPKYSGTLEYLYWNNALKAGFHERRTEKDSPHTSYLLI